MSEIQRYNQGFGCFGPMEKCKDGKWEKVEDAHRKISALEDTADFYENLWTEAIRREIRIAQRLSVSFALACSGWVIIAAALVRYAFTGAVL